MFVGIGREVGCRGSIFLEDTRITTFIAIPSCQQRYVALFAACVNCAHALRQEVSVDIRGEPYVFLLHSRIEELSGRLCAQLRKRMRTDGFRESGVCFF